MRQHHSASRLLAMCVLVFAWHIGGAPDVSAQDTVEAATEAQQLRPVVVSFQQRGEPAGATTPESSRWGVVAGFTPSWWYPPFFNQIGTGGDSFSVEGTELRIGFVRGQVRGSDWGVSFVRRALDQSSSWSDVRIDAEFTNTLSQDYVVSYRSRSAHVTGVEAHKSIMSAPLGGGRVQIGAVFAAGIGALRGGIERSRPVLPEEAFFPVVGGPTGGAPTGNLAVLDDVTFGLEIVPPGTTSPLVDEVGFSSRHLTWFQDTTFDFWVTGRVELAVDVHVTGGLKLRTSAGLNIPTAHVFDISAIYLFGAGGN